MSRRAWSIVTAGHFPAITNGWSLAQVAAYERRWFWHNWPTRAVAVIVLPFRGDPR